MTCNPTLNLVPNGPGGAPLIAPLDPNDLPQVDSDPGFGDLAKQMLGNLATPDDGFDQELADAEAAQLALDSTAAAMDTTLDAILAGLIAADDSKIDQPLGDFQSDLASGADFTGGIGAGLLPALAALPFSGPPTGLGETPAQVGAGQPVAHAGDAPFVFEYVNTEPIVWHQLQFGGPVLDGPNPPFAGLVGVDRQGTNQEPRVTFGIQINPTDAGTFTARLTLQVYGNLTGHPVIIGQHTIDLVFTVLP